MKTILNFITFKRVVCTFYCFLDSRLLKILAFSFMTHQKIKFINLSGSFCHFKTQTHRDTYRRKEFNKISLTHLSHVWMY